MHHVGSMLPKNKEVHFLFFCWAPPIVWIHSGTYRWNYVHIFAITMMLPTNTMLLACPSFRLCAKCFCGELRCVERILCPIWPNKLWSLEIVVASLKCMLMHKIIVFSVNEFLLTVGSPTAPGISTSILFISQKNWFVRLHVLFHYRFLM